MQNMYHHKQRKLSTDYVVGARPGSRERPSSCEGGESASKEDKKIEPSRQKAVKLVIKDDRYSIYDDEHISAKGQY